MTFIEIINSVLLRLREQSVLSVNDNPYTQLIGELVNVTKTEIENAWDWSALQSTVTLFTENGISNYVLTGTNVNSRIIDVINFTTHNYLKRESTKEFNYRFFMETVQNLEPLYYSLNGIDTASDSLKVDLYPVPNNIYEIKFDLTIPQTKLINDSDIPLIPSIVLIEGTIAKALEERGDDGGSPLQQQRYMALLADYISIEASKRPEEVDWVAT